MKAVQITKSWIVYPPNYKPGDGYTEHRFLRKAWRHACQLGVGADLHLVVRRKGRKGTSSSTFTHEFTVAESSK